MGAWGVLAFDNDTACDWGDSLEGTSDLKLVSATLASIDALDNAAFLDADIASEALAACEVLARLRGNPGYQNPYTEAVDNWVAAHPLAPPPQLLKLADRVIDRVLGEQSELRELWDESGESQAWRDAVEDLRSRVTG